jgi:small-conductance mechanosensitive channel
MASATTTLPQHVFTPPADLIGQSRLLVNETVAWLAANSLRILIAIAAGALIVAALLAVNKLARRLCRDGDALVTVGLTFQAALWVRELVLGFVEHRAGMSDQDHGSLASALGIIRFMVSFTLFSIALVLVLGNLGVNVTGLIAGLGVGGIAIGLAAQGIFKDLFAALSIIFDRPFRKGDSVKWNGISGTIERIGLKTTHIRALSGELVVVSNSDLLAKEVYNLARLNHRRMIQKLSLAHSTSDQGARHALELVRDVIETTEDCKLVRVGLMSIDKDGLQYELQFDVMSANYNEVIARQTEVNLAILQRFRQAGILFADPNGKAQDVPAPPEEPRRPRGPRVAEPAHGDAETAP